MFTIKQFLYLISRDISSKRLTADKVVQHLVLKGMAFLLITPFLCSSCVETVQSSIASENPGVFDCLKEGFSRISHWKMGRKLPIWLLCGPTVTYNLSHYLIYTLVRNFSLYINQQNSTTNGTESNNWKNQYKEIISSFWGHLIADIVLFPLQTIILRYESFCLKKDLTRSTVKPVYNEQIGQKRSLKASFSYNREFVITGNSL